jgi:1-acyl-sn-glycerol-3-phosphate acyltransferase
MNEGMADSLTSFERRAIAIARFVNERPRVKAIQSLFHRRVTQRWVKACLKNLLVIDGLEKVASYPRDRGILVCANHRSFFDQYAVMAILLDEYPWLNRVFFPIRSGFFYETWAGIAVNALIGGMAMYPPIFRDSTKSEHNRDAVARVIEELKVPGTIVGMHPEGTRGKGPDPYELLPGQPGVGEVIMKARPVVMPIFINGLGNDFGAQVVGNWGMGPRAGIPIVVCFGDPVDFGELMEGRPRPAQYKRVADRLMTVIAGLGEREKLVRAGRV